MSDSRRGQTEAEKELVLRCYEAGMKNGWASGEYERLDGNFIVEEDCLNKRSISFIDTTAKLKAFFKHGNWCLGCGIIYKNLFFLQQVDGGDEWATYHIKKDSIKQFESITWNGYIERKEFEKQLKKLMDENYWKR